MVVAPAAIAASSIVASAYLDAKLFIGEDLARGLSLAKTKWTLSRNDKNDRNSLHYVFEDMAIKRANNQCYVCDDMALTWRDVQLQSRQVAHFLLARGIKRGDVVAVFLPNKPAYPIIWLACLSISVIPAFINFNLVDKGLHHCINVVKSKLVLYDASLSSAIAPVAASLPEPQFVRWTDHFSPLSSFEKDSVATIVPPSNYFTVTPELLSTFPTTRLPDTHRSGIKWLDPAVLIFTSGTTGFPKPATMGHGRAHTAMIMWTRGHSFGYKTRVYTPMPLYHSTAAVLAVATMWNAGGTVIIGRKFSATKFWEQARAADANVIQYVGEVLRYLLAVPPTPLDKEHNVRLAYGNGCRPDVWNKFRDRFGVPVIAEFFSASEANTSLFNYNANTLGAGAVGHEGFLAARKMRDQQAIVKVDPLTEEPARDENGFCIRADFNEPGELISHIVSDSPYQSFAGYYGNAQGTEKKILRNVFAKDDCWFRTGDLLRKDPEGYTWFADRMGDTFRWRSENVATTEVQHALSSVVPESNVYGVLVPGHDGRAGCAAIAASANVDFAKLSRQVITSLPKYAQPVFVRLVKSHDLNGTAKQLKVLLRNEGVDPAVVRDPVYWLDPTVSRYVPFTSQDWEKLKAGKTKL
ncbi:putative bifunctional fatty acid transporter/acyl-CoA synthetase FAT1 [Meredithblackwellia eburnea MCA 4105]